MTTRTGERFLSYRIFLQFAGRDRLVDPGQVLINNSAGSKIEVTNFGVTHLAFGEADIAATGAQVTCGIIAIKLIVERGIGEKRRVAVLFRLGLTVRINSPAIANDEDYGRRHCALCRRLVSRTRAFTPSSGLTIISRASTSRS